MDTLMTKQFNKKIAIIAACASVILITRILKKKSHRRTLWTRQWLKRRDTGKGVLNMLNEELKLEDPLSYKNYLRLNSQQFEKLLDLLKNDIQKMDTFMRDSISARSRLELTLRFLATGETYRVYLDYSLNEALMDDIF